MENGHSASPWRIIRNNGNGSLKGVRCKHGFIAFAVQQSVSDSLLKIQEREKDFSLILAAPELLDVAIKAKSFMDERMDNNNPFDVAFYAELCRTIDKAEGV